MMSTYAVPKMTDGHGWEAMLIGEVLVLAHGFTPDTVKPRRAMSLNLFIKLIIGFRCDTIPNFTVQPHYLNWVRLSWKFICISISSLTGEV